MSIIGVIAAAAVNLIAPIIDLPQAAVNAVIAAITAITVSHNAARAYEDGRYNAANGTTTTNIQPNGQGVHE